MIYVPKNDTYNKCYVVQSENVIRGYDTYPSYNTNYSYRDYYINSDYMFRDGVGSWSNYATLPICLRDDLITHEEFYRVDYYKSLIIFAIMFVFIIFIPLKIIFQFFKKRGGN